MCRCAPMAIGVQIWPSGFAPSKGSKASVILRQDQDRFNEAWYRLDLPTRVRINNQIIFKSRELAIKKRDKVMANNVAYFAMSTNSNPVAKQRAHMLNMMEYYKGVNDTTRTTKTITFRPSTQVFMKELNKAALADMQSGRIK